MWLPVGTFVAGIALAVAAVVTGEADVSLVLIFPVFSGSSAIFLLGVLLIIASFLVGFAMIAADSRADMQQAGRPVQTPSPGEGKNKLQYGGVVMIGPIPIAFGSNRTIALVMLVIGIIAAIMLLGLVLAS